VFYTAPDGTSFNVECLSSGQQAEVDVEPSGSDRFTEALFERTDGTTFTPSGSFGFATITGPAGQEGNWFVQETRQVGDTTTVDASVLYESGNCVVQWQATSA
jgi:hypothetical protein